jgi:chromosome segregation ATPase
LSTREQPAFVDSDEPVAPKPVQRDRWAQLPQPSSREAAPPFVGGAGDNSDDFTSTPHASPIRHSPPSPKSEAVQEQPERPFMPRDRLATQEGDLGKKYHNAVMLIKHLRRQLAAAEAEVVQKTKLLDAANDRNLGLQQENEQQTELIKAFEMQVAELKKKARATISMTKKQLLAVRNEREEFRGKLAEMTSEKMRLEKDAALLQRRAAEEIEKHVREKEALQMLNAELKERADGLEGTKAEIESLTRETQDVRAENTKVHELNTKLVKQLATRTRQFNTLRKRMAEQAAGYEEKIASLTKSLSEQMERSDSERVREVEGMLDDLTKENDDLRRRFNELEALTTTRRQKELATNVEATRTENTRLKAAIVELQSQLRAVESDCSMKIDEAASENQVLRQKIKELEASGAGERTSSVTVLKQQIAELQSRSDELAGQLKQAEKNVRRPVGPRKTLTFSEINSFSIDPSAVPGTEPPVCDVRRPLTALQMQNRSVQRSRLLAVSDAESVYVGAGGQLDEMRLRLSFERTVLFESFELPKILRVSLPQSTHIDLLPESPLPRPVGGLTGRSDKRQLRLRFERSVIFNFNARPVNANY